MPLFSDSQPLLVQFLFGDGDRGSQFLGEDRNAMFLGHPSVGLKFKIIKLAFTMLLQSLDSSLPSWDDRGNPQLIACSGTAR